MTKSVDQETSAQKKRDQDTVRARTQKIRRSRFALFRVWNKGYEVKESRNKQQSRKKKDQARSMHKHRWVLVHKSHAIWTETTRHERLGMNMWLDDIRNQAFGERFVEKMKK